MHGETAVVIMLLLLVIFDGIFNAQYTAHTVYDISTRTHMKVTDTKSTCAGIVDTHTKLAMPSSAAGMHPYCELFVKGVLKSTTSK